MVITCKYTQKNQAKPCGKKAPYMIGWEPDGNGDIYWIPVCGTHDYIIALQNLERAFNITHREAIALNKEICNA